MAATDQVSHPSTPNSPNSSPPFETPGSPVTRPNKRRRGGRKRNRTRKKLARNASEDRFREQEDEDEREEGEEGDSDDSPAVHSSGVNSETPTPARKITTPNESINKPALIMKSPPKSLAALFLESVRSTTTDEYSLFGKAQSTPNMTILGSLPFPSSQKSIKTTIFKALPTPPTPNSHIATSIPTFPIPPKAAGPWQKDSVKFSSVSEISPRFKSVPSITTTISLPKVHPSLKRFREPEEEDDDEEEEEGEENQHSDVSPIVPVQTPQKGTSKSTASVTPKVVGPWQRDFVKWSSISYILPRF
ncbi:hypothetical protein DFS34DRAFT_495816 [Phlyctochytrium arcticum]|nr:hypothetical protein DFS34DRAFT_495816 [Phlyctochytrium arcticum]